MATGLEVTFSIVLYHSPLVLTCPHLRLRVLSLTGLKQPLPDQQSAITHVMVRHQHERQEVQKKTIYTSVGLYVGYRAHLADDHRWVLSYDRGLVEEL